jgi:hypothetical protein
MRKRHGRGGSKERRQLEFDCVTHHLNKDKARFMRRLQNRLVPKGECLLYRATLVDGYPGITFRFNKQIVKMKVHRVFAILKHGKPLPIGYDVGHTAECHSRACVKHIQLQHFISNCTTDPEGKHFAAP